MKICILVSSYEGSGSPFKEFDEYQNPGIYVKSHQFEQRIVTKANAEEKIDQIVEEGFDYIWNFMWGTPDENIAGVSAIKYLESKNVPIIGASSKYMSLTKLDFKKAFESANIKTPKGISITGDAYSINNLNLSDLTFPLIVKPSSGCGSEHLTSASVCHDLPELLGQIKILKSKMNHKTSYKVMIEEFIVGEEISAMVFETKDGVVCLEPIIYLFPKNRKPTEKFFDFESKFRGIENGEITFKIFNEDTELVDKIKEESVKAYEALGVLGSGYARVNLRLKDRELYMLKVNQTPAFFARIGNPYGDDFVIQTTFPGGHEKLVDTIISSKMRFDSIIREYRNSASMYNQLLAKLGSTHAPIWKKMIETFNFDGTVLDLGCGTGLLGNLIKAKYESQITGVDLSPDMVQHIQNYTKVHIGLIENVILDITSTHNHVVSSGALLFCDKRNYNKIISRMFEIATNSISLTVEDISEDYISKCAKIYRTTVFNHLHAIESYQIRPDWLLVYKNYEYFWQSPRTGSKIYGLVLRYEKVGIV